MKALLTALLFPLLCSAQNINISAPPHLNGKKLELIVFDGLHERIHRSAVIKDQTAMIDFNIAEDGMAKLMIDETSLGFVILIRDQPLKGSIQFSSSSLQIAWENSTENDALNKLLLRSEQYSKSAEQISKMMGEIPPFHPKQTSINDSLQRQYEILLSAYNSSLARLKSEYPNTYASEILTGLDALPTREDKPTWSEQFDNEPAFLHKHFFENVVFSDGRTATNPFLKNKILEYIFTYIEKHEQGLKNAIDLIMTKADRNDAVKKACAEILIGFFTDQGISEYVDYMNQEHLASCQIDFDKNIGEILKRSSPYRINDKIESAPINDFNNGELDLISGTTHHIVLMFWASWCSHCQEEIPQIKNFLASNGEKLTLKTISLDTLESDLAMSQPTLPQQVEQYCDLKGWDSNPAVQFGISATPSFILIDKGGRYLGRASSLVNLAVLLAEQQ